MINADRRHPPAARRFACFPFKRVNRCCRIVVTVREQRCHCRDVQTGHSGRTGVDWRESFRRPRPEQRTDNRLVESDGRVDSNDADGNRFDQKHEGKTVATFEF